ncbi:hypothetical protein ZWY2020_018884 [Hordeum vulgare]|nr:hypothetical protein ZWY2020_018884 [Hordeum vulgare]
MKFGKDFRSHLEGTLPDWKDKYLAYKALKKLIKTLPPDAVDQPPPPLPPPGHGDGPLGLGDWFARILDVELHKLNDFYMEREEWYVIRLQVLKERIERVKAKKNGAFTSKTEFTEEMLEIRRDFVLIHGEMILLQTYSSLNFAGLVKILKKYDKRTGGVLSLPFTQRARHQPFFTTEPLTRLVRECEANLEILFPVEDEVLESGSSSKHQAHNDAASRDPASSSDEKPQRFFHGEDGEACSGAVTSESSLLDSLTDSQVEYADKDDKEVQSKEQSSAQTDHNAEAERAWIKINLSMLF